MLSEEDRDFAAYLNLAVDDDWLGKHSGQFVTFSEGSFLGAYATEDEAVAVLLKLPAEVSKFYMHVTDEIVPSVELPSVWQLDVPPDTLEMCEDVVHAAQLIHKVWREESPPGNPEANRRLAARIIESLRRQSSERADT